MPKTVQEVLKESGLTDEQITALDAKAVTAFTSIITTADQTLSAAELAKRAQEQQFTEQIAPALDKWANTEANLTAERDYYKALAEKAKSGGFVQDAPPFTPAAAGTPPRTADGKFVAGQNPVPGSPQFVEGLRTEVAGAVKGILDLNWKYQSLYGSPMPDAPSELIKEAAAQHMDPIQYAAKKYDFAGKEAAKAAEQKKKETDAAVSAALAENDKKWAEKVGNNPDIRQAQTSRFSEIGKAVKSGTRPDPLKMTEAERDASTKRSIQAEVASSTVQ